ncbi:MAG: hypothetical protein KF716_23460 [Anaerolineae bacterium]|nr:hypothetical protein [Anaerolineae bacterium]
MTSEAQKNAGWLLPEQIDGYTEFVCYQVSVPNVPEYRSAFLGALQELAKWWNWEKTYEAGDTRASQAAAYWRELLAILGDCEGSMFDIRQKDGYPCIIEKTYDGTAWEDSVYINRCPPKIRMTGGLIQWFNPVIGAWETVDGGDERSDGDAPTPWPFGTVPVGEDGACLTAENITAFYQTCLSQLRADIELGRDVTAIAAGLVGLASVFIPSAIFGAIALSVGAAALAIGTAGLDDMLSPSHIDNFKCTVYCGCEPDGSVTASGFTEIRAGMSSWAGVVELEIIQNWLDGFGSVGLTRQGRAAGITSGNCVDCECEHGNCGLYVFDGSWEGFNINNGGTQSPVPPLWEYYGQGGLMTANGIKTVTRVTEFGNVAGMGIYRILDPLTVNAPNGIETEIKTRRENIGEGTNVPYSINVRYKTSGGGWTGGVFGRSPAFGAQDTLHIPNLWGAGTILTELEVLISSDDYSTNPIYLESVEIICAS